MKTGNKITGRTLLEAFLLFSIEFNVRIIGFLTLRFPLSVMICEMKEPFLGKTPITILLSGILLLELRRLREERKNTIKVAYI